MRLNDNDTVPSLALVDKTLEAEEGDDDPALEVIATETVPSIESAPEE